MSPANFDVQINGIDPGLLETRFASGCSMMNCDGACCKWGVWADPAERDEILKHVETVQKYMDPAQDHDPARWFDSEIVQDVDFPSGTCVGTQVRDNGCVFLNSEKLCVLQKAEIGEKNPALKLKPFYCKAFPVAIQNGSVIYDDYQKSDRIPCCSAVTGGALTVFDVLQEELELVLGKDGTNDLKSKHTA